MNWDLTPTLWQESFTDGAYTHCSPPFLQLTLLTGARNGNNGLELGTSDNCPLMSLTPSEKKLYQLYMSATPPMFSWNAKVHVEWNVRTLKLINLHLCMTGQTYFIVTHCMNWILFFASLLAFDCLIIEFSISSSDFLSQQCMGVKSNRYLIYYEKNNSLWIRPVWRTTRFRTVYISDTGQVTFWIRSMLTFWIRSLPECSVAQRVCASVSECKRICIRTGTVLIQNVGFCCVV